MITYPPPPTALPKRTFCSWRRTQVMFLVLFPSLISVAFSPALKKGEMTHFIGDLKKQVHPVFFLFFAVQTLTVDMFVLKHTGITLTKRKKIHTLLTAKILSGNM